MFAGARYVSGLGDILNSKTLVADAFGEPFVRQQGETNTERFGLSQACFKLPKTNDIMLVGGKPDAGDSVEVWNSRFGFWDVLEESPVPVDSVWYPASAVDEENGFAYVIGGDGFAGQTDSVLRWDGENWTELLAALPYPMMSVKATPLPRGDLFQCD